MYILNNHLKINAYLNVFELHSVFIAVRVLQASNLMQLHLHKRNCLGKAFRIQQQLQQQWLQHLAEWPDQAVLWLPVLQGRGARQHQEWLEEGGDC